LRTNVRSHSSTILFFCYVIGINKIICEYIAVEWLTPWLNSKKSQRAFADHHNIEESIVRKIKGPKEYHIPVETLQKICESRNLSLSDFFKLLEKKHGKFLNDGYDYK